MKTMRDWPDLNAADANWIEYNERGTFKEHHGSKANDLLDSDDYTQCPFPYSVWEITGHRASTDKPAAICRANQSTLDGALKHMAEGRVLVYNRKEEMVYLYPALCAENKALREALKACANTLDMLESVAARSQLIPSFTIPMDGHAVHVAWS